MKIDSFQMVIPKSGIIHIPEHILEQLVGQMTHIVIQEIDEKKATSKIHSLRGKYSHALSSTDEFSHNKKEEKRLER